MSKTRRKKKNSRKKRHYACIRIDASVTTHSLPIFSSPLATDVSAKTIWDQRQNPDGITAPQFTGIALFYHFVSRRVACTTGDEQPPFSALQLSKCSKCGPCMVCFHAHHTSAYFCGKLPIPTTPGSTTDYHRGTVLRQLKKKSKSPQGSQSSSVSGTWRLLLIRIS